MSWHLSNALLSNYANSHYLRGLEAVSLGESSSVGEPFAPWKSMPSALDDSCSAKMKATSHRSPFGMMYLPSTDDLGAGVLTWFLEGFPVRESVLPVKDLDWKILEADCGGSNGELSERYCLCSHTWKTHRCLWEEDLPWFSVNLPKWGMMHDGVCFRLGMLEHDTSVKGCGLSLPTLGFNEFKGSSSKRFRNSEEYRGAKMSEALRICAEDPIYTHPDFAEQLMMWPVTWTASEPLETAKFQQWLSSHGSV